MPRAQCIVHRGSSLLMVKHNHEGASWWCLPGGGVEPGETPAAAALRELHKECCLLGITIFRAEVGGWGDALSYPVSRI